MKIKLLGQNELPAETTPTATEIIDKGKVLMYIMLGMLVLVTYPALKRGFRAITK